MPLLNKFVLFPLIVVALLSLACNTPVGKALWPGDTEVEQIEVVEADLQILEEGFNIAVANGKISDPVVRMAIEDAIGAAHAALHEAKTSDDPDITRVLIQQAKLAVFKAAIQWATADSE